MAPAGSKRWCYTLNNPTDPDQSALLNKYCDYHIYEPEVAPDTGTPHIQGYISLKKRTLLSALKKLLPTAHWEQAKGAPSQNVAYCSKEGAAVIYGIQPKDMTGAADWTAARRAAEEGRLGDIPDDMYCRYINNFKRIRQDHPPNYPPLPYTTGIWVFGRTGVGKSRLVREIFTPAYLKPCNKWWDGYRDEEFVIIEDVDPNHKVLGHHMKLWADHYSFPAEQKGTTVVIRPKLVIVTSQYQIDEIWCDHQTRNALNRRFAYFGLDTNNVEEVRAELTSIKEAH